MIYAAPGASFLVSLSSAPTGLVGALGVRVFDSTDKTVIARTTAGITEYPAGSGEYTTTLLAPNTAGAYIVFWDDGVISPSTTAAEELTVAETLPESLFGAGELTDLSSVRQFMQKTVSDKLQDADLQVLITQASEAIQRYCNREFAPASSKVLRSFEFETNGRLELVDLKPYEYRTLHELVLDPDLTPVILNAVQYRTWPFPARDGTFFGVRLAELPDPVLPTGLAASPGLPYQTRRIDITADWGMLSVPSEVQHWTNVTVEAWVHLRRGTVPGQRQAELGEGPMPTIEDLPVPVRWGLKRWVRPTPEA